MIAGGGKEMKIGIMSDSHDNLSNISLVLDFFKRQGIELLIHLGDFVAPFVFDRFKDIGCDFLGIFGNNDGEKVGLRKRFEAIGRIEEGAYDVVISGKRFLLAHEDYKVRDFFEDDRYDFILFGHTHKLYIEEKKPFVINPGETCGYLTGKITAVILDTEQNKVEIFEKRYKA